MTTQASFRSLHFSEAATYWLNGRRSISTETKRDYENCIKPLSKFFGTLRLNDIQIGNLQTYQDGERTLKCNSDASCALRKLESGGPRRD
jgi:hypothetical protein